MHRGLYNLLRWKFSFPERRLAKILLVLKQGSPQKWSGWRKQSRPPPFPPELLDVTLSQGTAVTLLTWWHQKLCAWWAGVVTTSCQGHLLGFSSAMRVRQSHKTHRLVRPGGVFPPCNEVGKSRGEIAVAAGAAMAPLEAGPLSRLFLQCGIHTENGLHHAPLPRNWNEMLEWSKIK